MKRTLAEVAHALSGVPGFALPGNMAPGLAAAADFQPPALTYTNGAHVVEAEVDGETGAVRLTRYVIVHDCGHMINPMMVESDRVPHSEEMRMNSGLLGFSGRG